MNQPEIEPMRPTEMQAIVMAMAQVFVEIEGEAAAQKLGVYAEQFLALLEAPAVDPNQPSIFDGDFVVDPGGQFTADNGGYNLNARGRDD